MSTANRNMSSWLVPGQISIFYSYNSAEISEVARFDVRFLSSLYFDWNIQGFTGKYLTKTAGYCLTFLGKRAVRFFEFEKENFK